MRDVRHVLREPEVAVEVFDGEAIVIDFRTGSYYSLSAIAAEVVVALGLSHTGGEVALALAARYPSAAARIEGDVLALLARLLGDGLLVPVPEATRPASAMQTAPALDTYEPPLVERFEDMQEMLLLDPIHDVDLAGWPVQRPADDSTT